MLHWPSPDLAEHLLWLSEFLGWACAEAMLSLLGDASQAGGTEPAALKIRMCLCPGFSLGKGVWGRKEQCSSRLVVLLPWGERGLISLSVLCGCEQEH